MNEAASKMTAEAFPGFGPDDEQAVAGLFLDGAFAEVKRALPDEPLRRALLLCVWKYLRSTRGDPVRYVAVRKRLARLRRAAKKAHEAAKEFRDELVSLVDPGLAADGEAAFQLMLASRGRFDLKAIGDAVTMAEEVRASADATIQRLPPDRRGRTPDTERYVLMLTLAKLFEQQTGRDATVTWNEHEGKYEGAFFRLAELVDRAIASLLGIRPSTNSALGAFLRDVRNPRRRERRRARGTIPASRH